MSNEAPPYIIGVDGGGTGCRAAIGTFAQGVLARAEGGRANASSDPDLAIQNILSTITDAAKRADVTAQDMRDAVVHLGLAGIMSDSDGNRIAAGLPFNNIVVTEDMPTAVVGALGGQDGYLLSVGTGTIVAANKGGTFSSVGGWGFHLSDQASGAWLGRAALEQVLLCHDGLADHTGLTRALLQRFDNDPNSIVTFSMSARPRDYAALAPDIVRAAQAGDGIARSMMLKGAEYLKQGLARLGFRPGDRLCLTGGVGPHYAPFLPDDYLSGQTASKGSALDGAFTLARSRAANQRGQRR
ncbi:BadF/BadG/BcrA/BcrD ATPase family protein [Marivita sp. S2033]|uniref:BadF/BadG/BcrA/BcrD ATPase family protein n=1 Tax=Marivita sp. S2033 TaxID=3373187 RepID=UPI0039828D8A